MSSLLFRKTRFSPLLQNRHRKRLRQCPLCRPSRLRLLRKKRHRWQGRNCRTHFLRLMKHSRWPLQRMLLLLMHWKHSSSSSVRRASVAAAQVRRFAPFISLHSVRMLFITPTRLSVTLTKQNRKSAVAHWICISLLIASVICRVPSRVSARCLSVAAA